MCGIIGIVGQTEVNQALYDGLTVLQHRGQDAAGIMTCDSDGKFFLRKDNGLVKDVFHTRHMIRLRGKMGIGHIRYPTAGCSTSAESQPFYVNSPFGIALAHNGNLTNTKVLKEELFKTDQRHLNTDSDSEVLLNVLAHELQNSSELKPRPEDIFKAVAAVHSRCRGAYAAVAMISGVGVLAFRDPYGIRPAVIGKRETAKGPEYMVASESVAVDILDFELVRDIEPGECVFIDTEGNFHAQQCAANPVKSPCIFEYVYFARPDSMMDGISVHKSRMRMGTKLAQKIQREFPDHDIDVVIPIPDTSRSAALQLSYDLNVVYREGFIKNRYIGRTFIEPTQDIRERGVALKFNALVENLEGKRVIMIDDSLVRGTTAGPLVQMVRDAGATEVHLRITCPPITHACHFGVDMGHDGDLMAAHRSVAEIEEHIGADSLAFLSLDGMMRAVGSVEGYCNACFTGEYPIAIDEAQAKLSFERSLA